MLDPWDLIEINVIYTLKSPFCESLTISFGKISFQTHKKTKEYSFLMENLTLGVFFKSLGRKVKLSLICPHCECLIPVNFYSLIFFIYSDLLIVL